MRFPEDYNVKLSEHAVEFHLMWIDEDMKKETEAAMKSGKTFPKQVLDHIKFKKSSAAPTSPDGEG